MSDGQEEDDPQSPAELAATLAEMLTGAVPSEDMRRLEPEATFSAELSWRHTDTEGSA
ncbi:MAG: hypothetical protein ACR2OD_12590 [Gaiellaceae bacterium]